MKTKEIIKAMTRNFVIYFVIDYQHFSANALAQIRDFKIGGRIINKGRFADYKLFITITQEGRYGEQTG